MKEASIDIQFYFLMFRVEVLLNVKISLYRCVGKEIVDFSRKVFLLNTLHSLVDYLLLKLVFFTIDFENRSRSKRFQVLGFENSLLMKFV